MKVLCTSDKDFTNGQAYNFCLIEVGSIYTVIDQCVGFGKNGIQLPCYMLLEFYELMVCFDIRNFSPISDMDETELVNETEMITADIDSGA